MLAGMREFISKQALPKTTEVRARRYERDCRSYRADIFQKPSHQSACSVATALRAVLKPGAPCRS
jgi:hypothetical protein